MPTLIASITGRSFRLKINTGDRFVRTSFFWVYSTFEAVIVGEIFTTRARNFMQNYQDLRKG
ncbi:hypothetical protein [Nostoc sp.]|uniref:hypothetical protein n=1 Tax=Nostoc sp. TaxID=1180 RepID=UPI002FFCF1A1